MQTNLVLGVLLLIACAVCVPITSVDTQSLYVVINISQIGDEQLSNIKRTLNFNEDTKWIELGSQLFVSSKLDNYDTISNLNIPFTTLELPKGLRADPENLMVARGYHQSTFTEIGYVLVRGYGYTVFQPYEHAQLTIRHPHREQFFWFNANLELVKSSHINKQKSNTPYAEDIQQLVNSINESRWYNNLDTLSDWSRYYLSSEFPDAKSFLFNAMQSIPNLNVSLQQFVAEGHATDNIVGVLQGSVHPEKLIIVGGHYDSISPQPYTASPGAEDNGSGAVSVIELANVFSQTQPPYTMIFICYSAEEEGLYGSDYHAQTLVDAGIEGNVIKVAHIMDMVAYWDPQAAIPEVLLETSSTFSYLQPYYEEACAQYAQDGLQTALSLSPFGSDHVPYIDRNIPSLLIIDNFWDVYPAYHQTTDTIDKINTTIAMDILRMNVAAIASFMNNTTDHVSTAVHSDFNWVLVLYCVIGLVLTAVSL